MEATDVNIYPELKRELIGLLAQVSLDPDAIDTKISKLQERLGDQVYAEILYLLCHLRFPPEAAKEHWISIFEHREKLSEKLASLVDFRVALLDYFISVNQHFENPKIIEIQIFQKTQDFAIKEELTGLYNYRYFRSELERELKRVGRDGTSLSLALFDVDNFKWYNDRNGHLEGDKALKRVGEILKSAARDGDLVARYGGEEFAVLFPTAPKV